MNQMAGAGASVRAIVDQTDDRILVGGDFTNVNTVSVSRIARLNVDGSLDSTFNPGAGADGSIYALGETFLNGTRRILVGGQLRHGGRRHQPGPGPIE